MACCKKCGQIFKRSYKGSFEKYCDKCLKKIEKARVKNLNKLRKKRKNGK